MTGQEAVQRIHQEAWTRHKPGLNRIKELMQRLGNPHTKLNYIHITGTNGKGSTASLTAKILSCAGYKTGLYTSPHLWSFHERFQINGQPIPDDTLGQIAEKVIEAGRQMPEHATEFELMFAIAILYFQQEGCDLVVLEVGMGGRLDATNVIPCPEAAVLTNIGLDHTQQLGHTRALIAAEKAGIIKPGCHTVLYHQSDEVECVIRTVCQEKGAELTVTAPHTLTSLQSDQTGQSFLYRGKPYRIGLLGQYQMYNAATAIDVIGVLRTKGWVIPDAAVSAGLLTAQWPGRMELVHRNPDLILDGGHNAQCVEALVKSLVLLYPGRKFWFLVGVLSDKDYQAMCGWMIPYAQGFVTITPDSPRAMQAQELAQYLRTMGAEAAASDSTAHGLEQVLRLAQEDDVICACGSLYALGEIRHLLGLC